MVTELLCVHSSVGIEFLSDKQKVPGSSPGVRTMETWCKGSTLNDTIISVIKTATYFFMQFGTQ